MAGSGDNKSEKPTRRRLIKAREKGQIARSKDVPLALVLIGMIFIFFYSGRIILQSLELDMRYLLANCIHTDITVTYLSGIAYSILLHTGGLVASLMLAAVVFSVFANVIQGGLALSWEPLAFHFEKLSPKNGLKKIFSKNGIIELIKSIIMLVAIPFLSYQVVSKYLHLYPQLILMDAKQLLELTARITFEIFLRVGALLITVAIADYAFQKYRFLEQLKMTKKEVKEEFKEMEGDPITKSRIRRIQLQMSRKRMMSEIPKSDVIITNPTHYAVALSYKKESMDAPKVVAKGVGFLALKIIELAQEHKVPLVENKPLAQTLYKTVEVGDVIPASLYKTVAELLAYVYKARNAWKY